MALWMILSLGFFLGARHAMDADHVIAVTTIVSQEKTPRSALLIGLLWGLGHTATILAVGGTIILFQWVVPPALEQALELGVAAMLVILGVWNFARAIRPRHSHTPAPARRAWLQSLVVGVIHGLAGSAAVALMVLTTIREPLWAVLYLGIFGAGTMLGMSLMTTAMAVPMAAAQRRSWRLERPLQLVTGACSFSFGLFIAYRIGSSGF